MVRERLQRWRFHWDEKAPWVAVACVGFTVHWAAGGTMELLNGWVQHGHFDFRLAGINVVYLALCIASFRWLYSLRRVLFRPRTRLLRNESPEKRQHLVMFLSNLPMATGSFLNGVPKEVTLTGELETDLKALVNQKEQTGLRWPWERPLRSIQHHLGALQTVTILCSDESIRQVHWFGEVVGHYDALRQVTLRVFIHRPHDPPSFIACPTMQQTQGGWDFEHFDELSGAVSSLLHDFHQQGIADDQIVIDFTGGQKVTSVVATAVTFNRPLKAQYVQTNFPHAVISYDILLGLSETGGVGV